MKKRLCCLVRPFVECHNCKGLWCSECWSDIKTGYKKHIKGHPLGFYCKGKERMIDRDKYIPIVIAEEIVQRW